ncbi:hypothetical protein D3C81_912110 [compost metagenome]
MSAGIARCLPFGDLLFPLLLKLFFRTVAAVSQTLVQQFLPILTIDIQSFGLAIRTVISANIYTLIPIDPQPFQVLQLAFFPTFNIALYIGIFNTNNKFAT